MLNTARDRRRALRCLARARWVAVIAKEYPWPPRETGTLRRVSAVGRHGRLEFLRDCSMWLGENLSCRGGGLRA